MANQWDILICSLAYRTPKLEMLLAELERQITSAPINLARPPVGVRVYRDNRQASYTEKMHALVTSSRADYVSFVDDDDMVAPNYVTMILEALEQHPDQVGFRVRYTEGGVPQLPVIHSLSAGGWVNGSDVLRRDFTQFNPIRRELVVPWSGFEGSQPDRHWADAMRATGQVKTEVFIDEELYLYQHELADTFDISRSSLPIADPPPQPNAASFVTWLPTTTAPLTAG